MKNPKVKGYADLELALTEFFRDNPRKYVVKL